MMIGEVKEVAILDFDFISKMNRSKDKAVRKHNKVFLESPDDFLKLYFKVNV